MANFENITIEKGMYQTKGGISGALEKLDPSENYRGTALEGLDAFSRQLKRFDIKVKGRMITPLGASLLHTPELEGGKVIGLDKNCALEMVQAGGVVTDYDKLIDRQLERAAVTCTAGFSKIFTEASKVMSC